MVDPCFLFAAEIMDHPYACQLEPVKVCSIGPRMEKIGWPETKAGVEAAAAAVSVIYAHNLFSSGFLLFDAVWAFLPT